MNATERNEARERKWCVKCGREFELRVEIEGGAADWHAVPGQTGQPCRACGFRQHANMTESNPAPSAEVAR